EPVQIDIRLLRTPPFSGIPPDADEISLGQGADANRQRHPYFPAARRASLLIEAISTPPTSPLCSPAISASLSASTRFSCSSSKRNPARTTSLAEPYLPRSI